MEKGMSFFYDWEADVLYLSKGKPSANVESEELGDDIVVRLDPDSKEVIGFTILNFLQRFKEEKNVKQIPVEANFVLSKV